MSSITPPTANPFDQGLAIAARSRATLAVAGLAVTPDESNLLQQRQAVKAAEAAAQVATQKPQAFESFHLINTLT